MGFVVAILSWPPAEFLEQAKHARHSFDDLGSEARLLHNVFEMLTTRESQRMPSVVFVRVV